MAGKYNIRFQYSIWIAAVALITVAVLSLLHMWRDEQVQEHTLQWQAQLAARAVAQAVEPALTAHNLDAVDDAVGKVMKGEYVHLRVFARDNKGHNEVVYFWPRNQEPRGLLVVYQPVGSGANQVGEVELGVSRAPMMQRLLTGILIDLGWGLALVGLFVAGGMMVSAPVRNALRDLLEFVRSLEKGESHGKKLDSDLTEVDQVAKELNTVVRHIEEAQAVVTQTQTQLRATQKEMDEYTYVISHDLKEPLRGIDAFSKFLVNDYNDKLDDEGRHRLNVIRKSAQRMQRLINDLLKFSRLSHQKNPATMVGLNTMLMQVRVNLQYALDAKNADLRVNRLPIVVCDETAMTEVFYNLISNAIKYNDKRLPIIEVGCEEKPNPGTGAPEYEFYVRDNGVGIKKEYFDKIFQIFQRLHRDEEGTGIGLTIVRRVIEWHGGRIWLESEEGKGTAFYFTLPKREITQPGVVLETSAPAKKGTAPVGSSV